jgi:hypothetical protein
MTTSFVPIEPGPPQIAPASGSGYSQAQIDKLTKKCGKGLLGKCRKLDEAGIPLPGPPASAPTQPEKKTCYNTCDGSTYETTGDCTPRPCPTLPGKPPVTGGPGGIMCTILGIGCGPGGIETPPFQAPPSGSPAPSGNPPGAPTPTTTPIDDTSSLVDLFKSLWGSQVSAGTPTTSAPADGAVAVIPAQQTASDSGSMVKVVVLILILAGVGYGGYKLYKKAKG